MLNIQAFKWGVICSWFLYKRWFKESKHKFGHLNTNIGCCIIQSYCFCFVLTWRCQENIWRALIFFKFARRVYFDRKKSKGNGKLWIVTHMDHRTWINKLHFWKCDTCIVWILIVFIFALWQFHSFQVFKANSTLE